MLAQLVERRWAQQVDMCGGIDCSAAGLQGQGYLRGTQSHAHFESNRRPQGALRAIDRTADLWGKMNRKRLLDLRVTQKE